MLQFDFDNGMDSLFFKPLQFNVFPVKNGVSEIPNPVADNGSLGMFAGFVLHGLVLMTENEEINAWVKLRLFLCILVKPRLFNIVVITAFHLIFQFFQSVIVRPF